MNLPWHPAAEIFPMMDGSALDELAVDIAANGLRMPIVLHPDGSILDGRNRYAACVAAGVEPRFETWDGDGSAAAFVWSMNGSRRHLTVAERQIAAGRYAIELEREARERQVTNLRRGDAAPLAQIYADGETGRSSTKAGKLFGVGRGTVERAVTVLKHGTPEEIKAVKKGEAAVSAAARRIRERRKLQPAPTENVEPVDVEQPSVDAAAPSEGGSRIPLPDGMSMEDVARAALDLVREGATIDVAAGRVGANSSTLAKMMDVVLLADNESLNGNDRAVALAALTHMNAERRIAKIHEGIAPLLDRVWGKRNGKTSGDYRREGDKQRLDRFDRAFGTIIQACIAAPKIDLPYLSRERASFAAKELRGAIESVKELLRKVEGIHS